MKIGVCVADYDIRNDLPDLLRCLAQSQTVVVLAPPQEVQRLGTGPWEIRPVRAKAGGWNRLWLKLFSRLGKVPASRDNFLQHALYLLQKVDPRKRARAATWLRLRLKLPQVFSFDLLLRLLRGQVAEIGDLNAVLFITNVSSPELLAQALRAGLPCLAYVYSWDHAPKFDRFSLRMTRYFTWNQGVADDLAQLQDVAPSRTTPVGASQLVSLREYLNSPKARQRRIPFRYVYYGCAVGIPQLAVQEVRLAEWLAEELAQVDIGLKLIVRPYPMLRDTTCFRRLRTRPNVVFDDEYRAEVQERAIPREGLFAKFNLQEHAEAFFHCGTTMGLEGAYFDTPVFFLAPDDLDFGVSTDSELYFPRFFHTNHNEKYLLFPGFPNVVRRTADLRLRLDALLADRARFLDYNRVVRAETPLRSMEDIVRDLIRAATP